MEKQKDRQGSRAHSLGVASNQLDENLIKISNLPLKLYFKSVPAHSFRVIVDIAIKSRPVYNY